MENNKTAKELARELFNLWNEALKIKDKEKVAELYTKDNKFLPTLSPELRRGQEGAEKYFEHFLEKNPVGAITEDDADYGRNSDGSENQNELFHYGMYNFGVGPDDARQIVEARFTFIWQKDKKNEWKILHHHSSVRPK